MPTYDRYQTSLVLLRQIFTNLKHEVPVAYRVHMVDEF